MHRCHHRHTTSSTLISSRLAVGNDEQSLLLLSAVSSSHPRRAIATAADDRRHLESRVIHRLSLLSFPRVRRHRKNNHHHHCCCCHWREVTYYHHPHLQVHWQLLTHRCCSVTTEPYVASSDNINTAAPYPPYPHPPITLYRHQQHLNDHLICIIISSSPCPVDVIATWIHTDAIDEIMRSRSASRVTFVTHIIYCYWRMCNMCAPYCGGGWWFIQRSLL